MTYTKNNWNKLFLFVPLFMFLTNSTFGQNLEKVISIVEKLETNLKVMIANEQKSRHEEIEAIKKEIAELRQGKEPLTEPEILTADLIARLQAGNERFVNVTPLKKDFEKDRSETVGGQHPYAIVLTCADSRVPPELIFDESLGQLFVVRDAGNLVDSVILGSIEYAAEHLNVKLLLVLGHESCGAIKATVSSGEVPPNIGSLVWRLKSPVEKIKTMELKDNELVSACVEENVLYQMEQTIAQSQVLKELVEKNELTITGGVYNIETGRVKFLEMPKHNDLHEDSNKEISDHYGDLKKEAKSHLGNSNKEITEVSNEH